MNEYYRLFPLAVHVLEQERAFYSLVGAVFLGLVDFCFYRDILIKLFLGFVLLSHCFALEAFKIYFKHKTIYFSFFQI